MLTGAAPGGTLPATDLDRGRAVLAGLPDGGQPEAWICLPALPRTGHPAESLYVSALIRNGRPGGFGVLRTVRGKDQPITILVVTDTALAVTAVEIVTYREPYGGEVRRAAWRRQFTGRTPGERLRHNREILNISGATISARAVTDGVRMTLEDLDALRPRLPRPDEAGR